MPSLAVMWRPNRVHASAIRKATGAIVQRSPGRVRHKPSTRCAGKAGCFGYTCMPLCSFLKHTLRTVDRGCQPAPGLPCALGILLRAATDAKLGHNMPREWEGVRVIQFRAERRIRSRAPDAAQRRFGDALQSRGPCSSALLGRWVPALRRNALALQLVRDTRAENGAASYSVIASAATCPPKPSAKAEAIQTAGAEGVWIASSQELLAMTAERTAVRDAP